MAVVPVAVPSVAVRSVPAPLSPAIAGSGLGAGWRGWVLPPHIPSSNPGQTPMAVVVSVCRHVRQSPPQGPVWLSRGITLLPVLPAMHGYCHQDHKPPTIQISCTAFWQVGKATNSPTQLNLAHALRLLLWAAASKAEWHRPASKLLSQIIPGKSLASPCHQHMPTHTCTSSRQ